MTNCVSIALCLCVCFAGCRWARGSRRSWRSSEARDNTRQTRFTHGKHTTTHDKHGNHTTTHDKNGSLTVSTPARLRMSYAEILKSMKEKCKWKERKKKIQIKTNKVASGFFPWVSDNFWVSLVKLCVCVKEKVCACVCAFLWLNARAVWSVGFYHFSPCELWFIFFSFLFFSFLFFTFLFFAFIFFYFIFLLFFSFLFWSLFFLVAEMCCERWVQWKFRKLRVSWQSWS